MTGPRIRCCPSCAAGWSTGSRWSSCQNPSSTWTSGAPGGKRENLHVLDRPPDRPLLERDRRRVVAVGHHLPGARIHQVDEDLPARRAGTGSPRSGGSAARVLPPLVPPALDPRPEVLDGPAAPGALRRPGGRCLRGAGRRRPRARTGSRLLVAARRHEERRGRGETSTAEDDARAAPYSLPPCVWHVDCQPRLGARPLRGRGGAVRSGAPPGNLDRRRGRGRRHPLPRIALPAPRAGPRRGPGLGALHRAAPGRPRSARPGCPPLAASRRTHPALQARHGSGWSLPSRHPPPWPWCARCSRPAPSRAARPRRSWPAWRARTPARSSRWSAPAPEIGRLPGCAVRLGDGAVSRRHLQLLREGGAHRLRDLGGRNRARCNGRWLRAGRACCSPTETCSRWAARCSTTAAQRGGVPFAPHLIGDSPARSTRSSIRRRCWVKKLVKCIPRPRPRTAYTVTGPGRMSTFRMSRKAK